MSATVAPEPGETDVKVPEERPNSREDKTGPPPRKTGLFDFANTEAIKQKVRQEKLKPDPCNVCNYYHTTGLFQKIARHSHFENFTLTLIVINALWISIDTDLNKADTIIHAHPVFVTADIIFFSYFSLELFIRFMAFKKKCNCLRDGWFVFDSTLVALYAFDPFIIGIMAAVNGGGGLDLPTAVLRLFRLARLSRLVRMLRSLPELMVMIKGMVSAASSVGYTLGLLMMITYVFSIAMRNLVPADTQIEMQFFSSVPEAMHNLIIYGTFLDALCEYIPLVKADSPMVFIMSWIYIALASLTVMNMLIGVLCEVIAAVAEEEKESMIVDKVNDKFGEIVQELDTNNDGTLSWDEFKKILDHPQALSALESVGVDAECMVDLSEDFFFEDGVPVAVTFEAFMEMVLDLRGGQQATVKDVMILGKRFSGKFLKVAGRMDVLEEKMGIITYYVSGGKEGSKPGAVLDANADDSLPVIPGNVVLPELGMPELKP